MVYISRTTFHLKLETIKMLVPHAVSITEEDHQAHLIPTKDNLEEGESHKSYVDRFKTVATNVVNFPDLTNVTML